MTGESQHLPPSQQDSPVFQSWHCSSVTQLENSPVSMINFSQMNLSWTVSTAGRKWEDSRSLYSRGEAPLEPRSLSVGCRAGVWPHRSSSPPTSCWRCSTGGTPDTGGLPLLHRECGPASWYRRRGNRRTCDPAGHSHCRLYRPPPPPAVVSIGRGREGISSKIFHQQRIILLLVNTFTEPYGRKLKLIGSYL